MEIVQLKVQVNRAEFDALQADVKKLRGKTVKIKVDASGFNSLDKATLQSIRDVSGFVDATTKAKKASTDWAKAQKQVSDANTKAAAATKQVGTAASQAAKSSKLLGDSIGNIAAKMAGWQIMGELVSKPIAAFKDAIQTMKEVDSELVNIQKVTGSTDAEMAKLTERAYEMASAYGRTATEVLSASTEFARAGYGDQIESLSEMSILLQNVGDVSSETANKFLLSVDAAWKLGGSEKELMAVMDGLNEITNRNATDMDKLATGMTVAATYFAESGESIQTFSALMGAGTAITQRSGAEIGRALKAITMNIRQVRGETEDGELINDESIAKAAAALKDFAGISTMENGELRLTSDVLDELADKWDTLSQVQQSAIAEALGGKYHSNVVAALMGDWEKVEKMMTDYAEGAGSAMKENEIYMDSWEAKSKQLSSTWAEFVSHMVETDAIKGALDGTIAAIELLDTDAARTVTSVVALTAALMGVSKAESTISTSLLGTQVGKELALGFTLLSDGAITAKQAISTLGSVLLASPLVKTALVAGGILGIIKLADALNVSYEEQVDKISKLRNEYEELNSTEGEYQKLQDKRAAGFSLSKQEESRLQALEAQNKSLERQIQLEEQLAIEKWQAEYGSGQVVEYGDRRLGNYETTTRDVVVYEALANAQNELNELFTSGQISEANYRAGLEEVIATSNDYYTSLLNIRDAGGELSDAQEQFIAQYEEMTARLSAASEEGTMAARMVLEDFRQAVDGVFNGEHKQIINVDALQEELEAAGVAAEKIQEIIGNISADDGAIAFSIEADVETAIDQLEELGIAIESADGQSVSINYDDFMELGSQLGYANEQLWAFLGDAEALGNVSFSGAAGEFETLAGAMQAGMSALGGFDAAMGALQGAAAEAQNTKTEFTNLGETEASPEVEVVGADVAISKADALKVAIEGIPTAWTSTITINQVGSVPSFPKRAKGDSNFKGGTVLLGDQYSPTGKPMPELVITKGSAFIAGANGPEIRNLPAGSQILPYSETQKVLARSGMPTNSIPAFAGGANLWKYYYGTGSAGGAVDSSNASSGSVGRRGSSYVGGSGDGGGSGVDWEKRIKLLESELRLMEAQGKSASELAAKMREIQAALHGQAEQMRAIGGDQTEINDLSTEWWEIHEDILDAYRDEMKNERDLLRSQLELMENQGRSAGERIAKLKEIQANLEEEIALMKELGASQKEITDLTNDWYDAQKDIEGIQKDLWAELEDAVDYQLKQARKVRDERLEALDKELEALREAREEKQEQVTLEEKLLAVEQARIALANAQNERTVRTFNMETGQWEWVADAGVVKDAEEALDDAKKDLAEYEEELAYEAAVAEIEAKKEAIEEAYNALEEEWERITDSLQAPTRSINSILDDIAQHGTPQMKAQIENVNVMLGKLNDYIAGAISGDPFGSMMGGYGDTGSSKPGLGQPWDYSKDPRDFSELMANAETYPEYMYWAQQRENKIKQLGIDVDAEGFKTNDQIHDEWYKKHYGESAHIDKDGTLWAEVGADGKAPTDMGPGDIVMTAGGNYKITGYNDDGSYKSERLPDPDVTDFVTTPTTDAEFNSRMADLQYRSGNTPERTSSIAGSSNSSVVNDHSGNEYHIGNVTIGEAQASVMTVKELAQKANALSIYSNT